jgi:hypothetical protein
VATLAALVTAAAVVSPLGSAQASTASRVASSTNSLPDPSGGASYTYEPGHRRASWSRDHGDVGVNDDGSFAFPESGKPRPGRQATLTCTSIDVIPPAPAAPEA